MKFQLRFDRTVADHQTMLRWRARTFPARFRRDVVILYSIPAVVCGFILIFNPAVAAALAALVYGGLLLRVGVHPLRWYVDYRAGSMGRKIRADAEAQAALTFPAVVDIRDSGMMALVPGGQVALPWDGFEKVYEEPEGLFYMEVSDPTERGTFLPARAFASPRMMHKVFEFSRPRIQRERDAAS